jgi:hypothetical protein
VPQAKAQVADLDNNIWFGTIRPPLNPPTGQVVDRIAVGDNFTGLAYADQDLFGLGTTPTLFYSIRHDAVSGLSFLDTIATPVAPHTALPAVVDRFGLGAPTYNALAFAAPDLTYGPTILYTLRPDVAAPQFGTVTPAGAHQDQFAVGQQFGALAFSATDFNFGANLFYYLREDISGTHFGTIDPHQPGTVTDRFLLSLNTFDAMVYAGTDVGYGADLFYYIRHGASTGQHEFGTINPLTGVAVDRFAIGTTSDDFDALTFTPTDVGYGPNLFYYLRSTDTFPVPEPSSLAPVALVVMALGAA